jgi:transcription initiation factor IIE alpha subunit
MNFSDEYLCDRIMDAIDSKGEFTAEEVAKMLNKSPSRIRPLLVHLVGEGMLDYGDRKKQKISYRAHAAAC